MKVYLNVASLVLAVMSLQVAGGLLTALVSLTLDGQGESTLAIGLVAAALSFGYMAGAWFASPIVRAIGHIRAFSASASICTALIMGLALTEGAAAWGLIRLAQGATLALMFASAESWIMDVTPRDKKGAVTGLYQVLLKVALSAGGFFLVGHVAGDDVTPFLWAGLFMALAVAPMCATRASQPAIPDRAPFDLGMLFRVAPAAVISVFISGLNNTGVMSLLPVFAGSLRPQEAGTAAAVMLSAAWLGGVVSQWPAGLISDRVDRRRVVAALGLVASAAGFALFALSPQLGWLAVVALTALWGMGSLSFYSVAASHATDRAPPGQTSQVLSGLLFTWGAGSVIGPPVAGAVAQGPWGLTGLWAFSGVCLAALVVANLARIAVRRPAPAADRAPFVPATQNSLAGAQAGADLPPMAQADAAAEPSDAGTGNARIA